MKVLMISSGFPPLINTGAESFCYQLSKRLIQRGVEVQVATDTDTGQYDGIRLHKLFRVRNKYARKFFFDYYNPIGLLQMKRVLGKARPDVVHFHNIYGISSQLIAHASRQYATIVTIHDYWPFCFHSTMLSKGRVCTKNCKLCRFPLGYLTKKIKFRHLKNVYLVAPSNYMRNQLASAGFDNSVTIYNAVELPAERARDSKRLIYVGRLSHEKGVTLLVNAAKDFDTDIFGDGPLLCHLQQTCSRYTNIHLKGFVVGMEQEYRKGGILVVPSIWPENFPMVILEGMAYGLPIIASQVGGIPEMIEDEETGLTFEPGDEQALRNKIRRLINDDALRKRISSQARERAREFCWDKTLDSYIDTYESVIAGRR